MTSNMDGNGDASAPAVELRASVLDAAINLGLRNSVMNRWMFDPVDEKEDDEPAEHGTPALTSPSTSEESSMSPYSFGHSAYPYPKQYGTGKPGLDSGYADPPFMNTHGNISDMHSFPKDLTGNQKGPFAKIALAVPPPKNKLRKQKGSNGDGNGYESDGGYISESTKKVKAKKSFGWGKKVKDAEEENEGSDDGGYRSEATASMREKKKAGTRKKMKDRFMKDRHAPSPPPLPIGLDGRDPSVLLATINASVLPDSTSGFAAGPGSTSGHGHGTTDGYITDSGSTEKRGRTKKKSKTKDSKSSRATSPNTREEDSANGNAPTKKKSLFRLMGRSVSRDAKDRDRPRIEDEAPPPMPSLPMPLPIAERFARSGAGTPVGNMSSTALSSPSLSKLDFGSGFIESAASMELRSSGSFDTLVPPKVYDAARSDSPWSYRSAPGRFGATSLEVDERSGSTSLELPRERKNSGGMSPFSIMHPPENGASARNGYLEHAQGDSTSSVTNTSDANGTSLDLGRSPTKRIGKLFPFVHSSGNSSGDSTKTSKPPISRPNPHLTRMSLNLPNPHDIASALTSSMRGNGNVKYSVDGRPESPESFMMIDENDHVPTPNHRQGFGDADAKLIDNPNDPFYSSNELASSATSRSSEAPSSSSGLSTRRRAILHGLEIDVTPTQSRSGTPVPNSDLSQDDAKAARASVLAYYEVPPPSPPPTGPLPAPPQFPSSSAPGSPRQEKEAQLLSPGRPFASRSPSPLGLGARFTQSRSPSPGMMGTVLRGRESPFPTRPVLPPQDSRQLVERVERYKALYATDGSGSDERIEDENGWEQRERDVEREDEVVDKHSSEYIRQARARGEKRVYFDIRRSQLRDAGVDAFFEDVDPIIPEIEVKPADDSDYVDFDDETDARLRYSRADTDTSTGGLDIVEGAEGEADEASDRNSYAASSVYSRPSSSYSVLDADNSARVRDGFVKRAAALFGQEHGRLLREEIPEVPKVPAEFKDTGMGSGVGAAGQRGRTDLKTTSSPYRF